MKFKPLKAFQTFLQKSKFSGIVVAVISFMLILLFSFTSIYKDFENKLYDLRFRIKPAVHEWEYLAFLNVDEQSINNIGEYPWPRNIYAKGLDTLKDVGIRQNTFDFEFLDKTQDRLNAEAMNKLREKIVKKMKISSDDISMLSESNDAILAKSIRNIGNVIIPFHFNEDKINKYDISEEEQREIDKAKEIFLKKASVKLTRKEIEKFRNFIDPLKVDLGLPIPEIINAGHGFGYTDRDPDTDGTERRIRLVRVFGDRLFFQMGLAMLMDICGVGINNVEVNPGKNLILKNAVNPMTFEKKDIVIPIDDKGMMYINWAGPGLLADSFHDLQIPFSALLEYPLVKDSVHDTLDEIDMTTGGGKLNTFNKEIESQYKSFNSVTDLHKKKEIRNKIIDLRKKIINTQDQYLQPEIDELESSLKKKDDAELRAELEKYKTAIKIVKWVEDLRDCISIVGLTAQGTQDLGVIPISNKYMMVGTYHNVVNTVINAAFIKPIDKIYNLLIMLALALLMGYFIQRISAKIAMIIIISAIILINILNIGAFAFFNIWIEELGTTLAVFLPSFIIAGIKMMQEESQKRYIKSAFSRYLAPSVIENIIESPEALKLGGDEFNVSIFFSDIEKFSTISEKLSPTELVELLNEYLSAMTEIILSHGGTVDKYIGDAIMAFYGAPLRYEDHALRCCLASIDMKKRLRELHDHWRSAGKDVLKVRMGMNSGKAVIGNMGSSTQMGYTAMGDAVNLASRLEGVNKYYSTYAMISESTYEYVKDQIDVRKLDIVRVVGKEEPIVIYELLGKKGELPEKIYSLLDRYYKALEYFGQREWNKAISEFKQGLKIVPDDGPCQKYIERCEKYLKRPPSKSWDGVYMLTSK